jgi:DNA polymerase-3 subunit epsilon
MIGSGRNRKAAEEWARRILDSSDWVILDTETTGLKDAEIVQIGVLGPGETVLLDTYVKPLFPIPAAASSIHGIRDEDVEDAPILVALLPQLADLLHGKRTLVYNAVFDRETLSGCLERRWCPDDLLFETYQQRRAEVTEWISRIDWECVMWPYSVWVGERSRKGFRRQRLPGGDHSAIGDCRATLEVIRMMAASSTSERDECANMETNFNAGDIVRVHASGRCPARIGRVTRVEKDKRTYAPLVWVRFDEGGPEHSYYPNQVQKTVDGEPGLFDPFLPFHEPS